MAMPPQPLDQLSGQPPAAPKGPTFAGMAGGQQPGMMGGGAASFSPGMSQISSAAVRMAMEIDQALKVLAQQMPTMLPWVEQVTTELRMQVSQAISSGAIPTAAVPGGNMASFPDGSGQL